MGFVNELAHRVETLEAANAALRASLDEAIKIIGGAVIGLQDAAAKTVVISPAANQNREPDYPLVAVPFIRDCTQIPVNSFKPAMAALGLLRRELIHGRASYHVTEAGEPFFFTRGYPACPQFPELFLTPQGVAKVQELFDQGRLLRRTLD